MKVSINIDVDNKDLLEFIAGLNPSVIEPVLKTVLNPDLIKPLITSLASPEMMKSIVEDGIKPAIKDLGFTIKL